MPVSLFQPMGRIFTTAFADRSQKTVTWIRHGALLPVEIPALFETEYQPVSLDGLEVADAQPTAFVEVAVARRYEGTRPLKSLFDNRDRIIAGGVTYRVAECRPDGQVMVVVGLRRPGE